MTPNIPQHVTPRRSVARSWPQGRLQRPSRNRYEARSWHAARYWPAGLPGGQSGAINSAALGVALGVIGIIIVTALSFVYLGQVLTTASQGTSIQDLEQHISELRQKQQELELEGASLRSIQTVEQRVQQLNLEIADKVTYLTLPDQRVAYAR
ncbi:MAG: hypothetical protein COT71_00685 [Candidatus Andersenbacteria bacterium CG10_big_fil_rev_8_21_14_0_10_54_11]|uniref:Septum formation initiator n=1 Tax=Candidatus Andersenbacteria bacterium CG10_big_fil_rev_8_21_14_0_10_54_11 TaxID=1974485 RepID=A0A2M6X056_9BACT|nr:MAG: hypothetical protein COT71_00685 [Candidatus Andersenbacteria bacterium CG10_big_fil_rev_8_21_14_0_10_54_11]